MFSIGVLSSYRWNRWGRGQEGGKPLPAPSCLFAPRSQRFHRWSPKKKKEKFGS